MSTDPRARARLARLEAEAERALAEPHGGDEPKARPDVLADCFPEQLAFIKDPSPLKLAFCTRRAAKSYSVALDMIDDALDHDRALYRIVGLSRQELKDIYWVSILKEIDLKYGLGATFNETELSMTLGNGAQLRLVGVDANERERRKLLGGKLRKAAVDEAQSFGTDLRELVYGTLKPAVADWRGSISVCGTPGNLTGGFFHDLTRGCRAGSLGSASIREAGWSAHSWTSYDNPYLREQWRAEIESLIAANPLVQETPWFRQNYLGEWVVDLDARCYRFDPSRNTFDGVLPRFTDKRGRWHYVLAIDLGYHPDPSAFAVLAYHDFTDCLFAVESWKQWRMDITDVANRVKLYDRSYAFDAYVIDGANKQAVEEMRRRHGLQLTDADKRGKSDFVELMNAEFILGKILIDPSACCQGQHDQNLKGKVPESLALVDELQGLIWDPRKLVSGKREEHPGCPNHLTDALLYGWRHCYQYLAVPEEKPLVPGTPEWFKAESDRAWDQELEAMAVRKLEEEEEERDSDWDPRFN